MELGIGIGWRPEIADAVERLPGVDWVEVVAENICPGHLPAALTRLRSRGTRIIPHGVSLGLGGADRPSEARLADLAERATALDAPLVTEHIAFVRAGGILTASPQLEAGHLLPVPRTWDALKVLCENVRIAQDLLPVPLALENIAALISWPDEELTEGQFLAELVERTGVRLLIDVANLHTNHVNRGEDPAKALDELPVEAIAYVHVAGGVERDGVWHDTHAHPVTRPVLDVLTELRSRVSPPGVLLERDDDFPPPAELEAELTTIRATLAAAAGQGRSSARDGAAGPGTARTRTTPAAPNVTDAAPTPKLSAAPTRAASAASRGTDVRPRGTSPATGAPGAAGRVPVSVAVGAPSSPAAAGQAVREHGQARAGDGLVALPPTPTTASSRGEAPAADGGPKACAQLREGAGQGSPTDTLAMRERVGLAQAALLSALVAGTPVPEGFDSRRLRVQSHALAAKRADVVGKVAPELPEILGAGYRSAFLAYAKSRPMQAGYRRDALDFAEHLLIAGRPEEDSARRRLTRWWEERATPHPPGRATRFVRAARAALVRR
ncbi:DUF692 family protein [Streptomyces sp. NBC_01142]|uniref:DUF692 domain-containing protein n=1 Tax=Streptomyces sp. NBC_01142 TaxID=2975865 RepID=UPI002257F2B1|nr:DUF692 family multinuclear iron-containing protein [Streptomyces sp. NBC_01142]MCX4820005.1 DUF692 family protein [Streptomyces sp. NBC_01142]